MVPEILALPGSKTSRPLRRGCGNLRAEEAVMAPKAGQELVRDPQPYGVLEAEASKHHAVLKETQKRYR